MTHSHSSARSGKELWTILWPWPEGVAHFRSLVPRVPTACLAPHPVHALCQGLKSCLLPLQSLHCGSARSWALASFHLFGEDEFCQGCANHHLEIIFGDGKLFSSRRWRLHSNYEVRLGHSRQPCQGEVTIQRHPGDCVYRLTFGICCGEHAVL